MGKRIAAVLMLVLLLAGCGRPKETTVIYAECVGCYRDTVPSEYGGTMTEYVVDFIYNNEIYSIEDAVSYYRAINYVYSGIWVRVVLEDGKIKEIVEVLE